MQDEKKKEIEEKSGRTEGWLLTGHLAQACFSLREGRGEGETEAMCIWPSTCLSGKLTQHQTIGKKDYHSHTHCWIIAYICKNVYIASVNRFPENSKKQCEGEQYGRQGTDTSEAERWRDHGPTPIACIPTCTHIVWTFICTQECSRAHKQPHWVSGSMQWVSAPAAYVDPCINNVPWETVKWYYGP